MEGGIEDGGTEEREGGKGGRSSCSTRREGHLGLVQVRAEGSTGSLHLTYCNSTPAQLPLHVSEAVVLQATGPHSLYTPDQHSTLGQGWDAAHDRKSMRTQKRGNFRAHFESQGGLAEIQGWDPNPTSLPPPTCYTP